MKDMIDTVICGESLSVMRERMPDNYFDSIITDPPYGLSFMGKGWDHGVPGILYWAECLRVAKPGAILMAFGGTRTYHRLTCAIEDAGWEIRDCMQWIYGSGFPKSLDISKAIDKRYKKRPEYYALAKLITEGRIAAGLSQKDIAGHFLSKTGGLTGCVWNWENAKNVPTTEQWRVLKNLLSLIDDFDWLIEQETKRWEEAEREVVGKMQAPADSIYSQGQDKMSSDVSITAPATELAQQWDGWGTALKPSWEPIIVAMKPLDGTFAENAEKWGVAGLWIDGGRIGTEDNTSRPCGIKRDVYGGFDKSITTENSPQGRFPANIILDEEAAVLLDEQSGELTSGAKDGSYDGWGTGREIYGDVKPYHHHCRASSGGASRFFYCAKSSRAERNAGCEGMEAKSGADKTGRKPGSPGLVGNAALGYDANPYANGTPSKNHHPTVKPLALMEYLCKLTKTPTGGIVLDPFAGSGSTGIAAYMTGRQYILIEKEADYCKIAERRIQEERDKYALLETANG